MFSYSTIFQQLVPELSGNEDTGVSKQMPEEMTLSLLLIPIDFSFRLNVVFPPWLLFTFLFRDYYCFINIFNSNYRRNNPDNAEKVLYIDNVKNSVKQSKNKINKRMLICYSKSNETNESVCKYLTLARTSKINKYTQKTYITKLQDNTLTQRSKLKTITAFLARYHSSKVFPSLSNEMKLYLTFNQIPLPSLTH